MDNNNFEQQFTQNVNAGAAVQPMEVGTSSSKLPLIIAVALAVITLIESIILIITLNNYFAATSEESYEIGEEVADESGYENNFAYDENDNLSAIKATCVAKDGSSYTLDLSNNYQYAGTGTSANATGTYTISNDSLVALSGSNKVLYYDGLNLADGLTIYDCEGETSTGTNNGTNTESNTGTDTDTDVDVETDTESDAE